MNGRALFCCRKSRFYLPGAGAFLYTYSMQRSKQNQIRRLLAPFGQAAVVWLLTVAMVVCGFSLNYGCGCSCCGGQQKSVTSSPSCECCGQNAGLGCCCGAQSTQGCGCDTRVDVSFDLSLVDVAVVFSPAVFVGALGQRSWGIDDQPIRSMRLFAGHRFTDSLRKHLLYCVWLN